VVANEAYRAAGARGEEDLRRMQMRPHIICHMLCSVDGKIDGTSLKAVIGAGEYPRVEIIPIQKLDEAYKKVLGRRSRIQIRDRHEHAGVALWKQRCYRKER
jgi:hypothetical protein